MTADVEDLVKRLRAEPWLHPTSATSAAIQPPHPLCRKAADEIEELCDAVRFNLDMVLAERSRAEVAERERDALKVEAEKLRAALDPFARAARAIPRDDPGPFRLETLTGYRVIHRSELERARSALNHDGEK